MVTARSPPELGRPRWRRRRAETPVSAAPSKEEKERVALEARRFLRSVGNKRYGTFLKELKARGLSVTTSEAAELYHRVEPSVYGSAHSQVASAFGGVDPPTLPA